jgi:two-component system cell cycle sensor histidine kinase PleC
MRPGRAAATSHDRQRRFINLLSVGAVAMLCLIGYLIWSSYREAIQTAETTSRNYAAIIEARLDASLRRADASLLQLTHNVPVAALNKEAIPRYAGELDAALDSEMVDFPELIGLRIFDANGDQFYSSNDGFGTAPNTGHRRFFQQARDGAPGSLVISDVVRGSNTGVSFVIVARALRDEQGRFMGAVAANFNLDYFQKLFRSLDLGRQGVLAIIRTDDFSQVLRWPQIGNELNQKLELASPIRAIVTSGVKTLTSEAKYRSDGISRIHSINVLHSYPFFVTAAFAVDDVLSGWRIRSLAVSLLALLLLFLLSGLLARLWRAEAKQEHVVSELAQSEERYVLAVNGVNEGIWDWNIITGEVYHSPRWKHLLGYRDDELENKSSAFLDRIHPDDVQKVKDALETHFKENTPYAVEVRLRLKDDSYSWFLVRGGAHRETTGRPVRMVGSIKDISEDMAAREELLNARSRAEEANNAKSNFLASMSHELRTPLNAILGFSEVIGDEMMGPVGTPIYREYAGYINNSGKHLLAIINDVLDMAKIGSGQFVLQEDYVDLRQVIECCLPMVQQMATANGVGLRAIPNATSLLWADRKRVDQILINLLSNAVKFTPNGGTVSVEAHVCEDGSLALIVADTGIGMTPEQIHTAMQPFRQVDSTLGRKYEGTGLGLPLTDGLMHLHGGRLDITSETGVGTIVTAIFPVNRVRHSRGDWSDRDDVLQSVERIST